MVSTYHFVLWEVIFLANLCFCCFFPGQARISQVSHSNGEVESVELTDSEIHIISGGTILYVVNPEVNENLEILLLIDLSELPKGVALQVVLSPQYNLLLMVFVYIYHIFLVICGNKFCYLLYIWVLCRAFI